jgi:hypothetical protein
MGRGDATRGRCLAALYRIGGRRPRSSTAWVSSPNPPGDIQESKAWGGPRWASWALRHLPPVAAVPLLTTRAQAAHGESHAGQVAARFDAPLAKCLSIAGASPKPCVRSQPKHSV